MTSQFHVIRFSPVPEFTEPVNVALLLVDEHGRSRLLYNAAVPKLQCVAPAFDKGLLVFLLQRLSSKVSGIRVSAALEILRAESAQIQLGDACHYYGAFDETSEAQLKETYLDVHRRRQPVAAGMKVKHIETKIEDVLVSQFHVPADRLHRRARPREFLSERVYAAVRGNSFHIARVIDGTKALVLVDGINLASSSNYIQSRAQKIGYAFYAMEPVARELQRTESRKLVRAAVCFSEGAKSGDARIDYALHLLGQESDVLIDPNNAEDSRKATCHRARRRRHAAHNLAIVAT